MQNKLIAVHFLQFYDNSVKNKDYVTIRIYKKYKMKKNISSILISCLLAQIYGCYSMRVMTSEELKNFNGANDIILKTNQNEILIYRKSSEFNPMDWVASDSSISIKTKEQVQWDNYYKLVDKSTEIKFNEIESVEIEEFDILETSVLMTGIIVIFIFLAAVGSTAGAVGSI